MPIAGERARATVRQGAVLVLGLAAAVCLVATELSTISSTHILSASCDDLAARSLADNCATLGGERHGYTLIVLGLLAAAMAWGAAMRGRRPAAMVLVAIGVVVAAVALIVDLPTLGDTTTMDQLFSDVRTEVGTGFWLELAGAAAALAAGVVGLTARRAAPAAAVSSGAGTRPVSPRRPSPGSDPAAAA